MAKRPVPRYDFKAFGAAIKAAREGCKESRKKVGDEMFISPRYLANIENKGQHPSLQIFFELIQRYHISVDQFLLETPPEKNTQRRQLDALLDGMSDTGIRIVTASKKRPSKLPEEWEVIPDTHEGIVTQEEFDTVQQLMTSRRREQNAGGFENIFSGVIKCADCGYAMRAASANRRKRPDIIDCVQYTCNNYGRYGNVMCTAHSIEARDLFNAVLADINRFADMAVNDEKAVRAIERRLTETDQSRAKSLEKEKKKLNKRLAELDRLFSSLYEDKVMERITERNFEMMSGKYQKEQLEIEARLKEVTETLNESYEKSRGIRDFLALIRNYQGLKELDATVINALIDKILVSEREKLADGTVRQEIKIYYKFIGFVGELHITPTKRWTALKPKNCTVCGVEYVPSSGISKYCPACAKRIQREKSNESKRRSRERNRRACIELSAKNDRLIWAAGGAGRQGRGAKGQNKSGDGNPVAAFVCFMRLLGRFALAVALRRRLRRAEPPGLKHEENQREQDKQRAQKQQRPAHEAEKRRHFDLALVGDGAHHQIGGVADVGHRAHEHRAHRNRPQGFRQRVHQKLRVARGHVEENQVSRGVVQERRQGARHPKIHGVDGLARGVVGHVHQKAQVARLARAQNRDHGSDGDEDAHEQLRDFDDGLEVELIAHAHGLGGEGQGNGGDADENRVAQQILQLHIHAPQPEGNSGLPHARKHHGADRAQQQRDVELAEHLDFGLGFGQRLGAIARFFVQMAVQQEENGQQECHRKDERQQHVQESPAERHALQKAQKQRRIAQGREAAADVGDQKDEENHHVHFVRAVLQGAQDRADHQHRRARRAHQRREHGADEKQPRVGHRRSAQIPHDQDAA